MEYNLYGKYNMRAECTGVLKKSADFFKSFSFESTSGNNEHVTAL